MNLIVEKRELNPTTTLLKLSAPEIAAKALPGQFVIVRTGQLGERIPLTISDYNRTAGTVTIIFQKVGATTMLLGSLKEGESVTDLAGPLGMPTELDGYRKVAVVGGGVGCAIAYPQAKFLHTNGAQVDLIAGFRSKEIVILEEEMRAASTRFFLATDDGSYGEKGFVTDILAKQIEAGANYDAVIAIGPVPMMRAVANVTRPYQIKTIVSLNPIMIDGTGMCGGCRVTVGGKVKFACVDGPDFDGHQVDFDQLMRRNSAFKAQETEKKDHVCHLFGGN
ncbi:MAG: sulfide/dihydroorotate dehydrogenase-like FAD/NAD-binding protein [Pygmaiobacter massiliensis]|nr:sulfide/dihydroorotate dehydrogenase-like FAD/NAD-binding protein [Pygmaiobacter massiliensis]